MRKEAPKRSIEELLEPPPAEKPPLEWFSGIAKREEGIMRILFSNILETRNNGELYRQLLEWKDAMANDRIGQHQPREKRLTAMEIVTFASHYVKAKRLLS